MGRYQSRAWEKRVTNGKQRRRIGRALPMRRLRLEPLEDRRLLSFSSGFEPDGGNDYATAQDDLLLEIAFSGAAGILTAAPEAPDLLAESDTGVSNADNLTNLDNNALEKTLRFSVGGTIAGATVTLYADGTAIGSAVADSATTTVTTNGNFDLADGARAITARQTSPGEEESADSAALTVVVDTVGPLVAPARLGWYDTSGCAQGVTVSASLAYVADGTAGLVVLDVSDPAARVLVSTLDTSGYAFGVAVSGSRAYVADGGAGLQIIDLASPSAPALLGGFDTGGTAYSIAISGNLAYVADGTAGLAIVDVTDPAAPAVVGTCDTLGVAYGVAVLGTRAYVADYGAGLAIIDVANPAAPVQLGAYYTDGLAFGVAVSGTVAYVADYDAGLTIIDVANPAAPVKLSAFDTSGLAFGVAVSGTVAYVADDTAGLEAIDVSNPAAPLALGALDTTGEARGVAVTGTTAYIADRIAGVQIVDASVPAPLPTAAPDLQAASDTGISDTDNITGDNTPTFGFSVPGGWYFQLYRDGVQISDACQTGTSYTTAPQADGTYAYAIAAVDAAGNAAALSPALSVTVDTTIPTAPDLAAVSDTGVSSADNLTKLDNSAPDKSLQFSVGNTVPGATVTLYAGGVAIGSAVADGAATTVTTNGSVDLTDGIHTITATQTIPGRSPTTDSAALHVMIDTGAPLTAPPLDLRAASDSGISSTDNVTSNRTLTFDVAVPTGSYARIYRDGVQVSGDFETGAAYTTTVESDGTYDFAVAAVDAAGNAATLSPALSVTVDTTIPTAPDLAGLSDTGISSTDNLTNLDNSQAAKTLQFTVGNTVAGAALVLYADGAIIGAALADGSTTTVITNGGIDLADGTHTITARQAVPGRPQSTDSAVLRITVDTTAPPAPPALDLQAASDSGLSCTDNVTSNTTLTFDVAVPAGSYFRVSRDGAQISGDCETGAAYTTTIEADGTYRFTVASVDDAGNASVPSASLSVTVDSRIPSAPDLLAACDSGISSTDDVTFFDNSEPGKSLQFAVGKTVTGATVTVYADGVAIGNAVADGATTIVATNGSRDLAEGRHAITATQTLPGQPRSGESAPLAVMIDTLAPVCIKPRPLGTLDTSGTAFGVALSGTVAYVADYGAGLQVLDIADPAMPVRKGGYDTSGLASAVAVSGTRAYVADYGPGLVIFDVSNPAAPLRLGAYDTSGYARDVVVSGPFAYVADYSAGLQIIYIGDPAAPIRLGTYDTSGAANAVAVSGSLAYVADSAAGLAIIDVANPIAPVWKGGYDTAGLARGVTLAGTLAYVADYSAGLVILDVSNPAAPVLVATLDTPGLANDVVVSGTLAYVADDTAGLTIIDVSNPAAPVLLATYDTAGSAYDVTVVGTRAYVADGSAGLVVLDLGNAVPALDLQPASDTGISNTDNITSDATPTFDLAVPASCSFRVYRDGVQISGDFETGVTYTAPVQGDGTCSYTMAIVDVAGNVSAPSAALAVTVDSLIPATPELLAVSDTGISSTDRLTNLDNSAPDKALQFSVADTVAGATVTLYADGTAIGSAVADGTTTTVTTNGAYDLVDGARVIAARQTVPGRPETADSAAVTVTIDTLGPLYLRPVSLGGYDTSGRAANVVVSGTLAYVADKEGGLVIVDVANPATPVRLSATTTRYAYEVAVSGTVAYVADDLAGLLIFNVSNPTAPGWLGTCLVGGTAYGVTVVGTRAYVAAGSAGLQIVDVSNPAAPRRLGGYGTIGPARAVTVSGTLAYVADERSLQIIDVSNPTLPVRVGGSDASAIDVAVSGALAYLTDGSTLKIIDVSKPDAPVRLGEYSTGAFGLAVSGTRVYAAAYVAGLRILDASNPLSPTLVGVYKTNGYAYGVAVSGTLAYVAADERGLEVIDLGGPEPPTAPDLQPASDTGISNTDNITDDNTPTFDLSLLAGSCFRFYRDGVQISGNYESGTSFTAPVQTDGTHPYSLALVDSAGNTSPQSPAVAVTIDTQVPTVKNLLVSGSGWTSEFLTDLTAAGSQNVGGYSIPVGTGSQLAPLAWGNIDQIKIVFSEGVMVDKDDLTLSGVNTPSYDVAGATFSYDPASFTATWKLASPLAADKLAIRLNAGGASPVEDAMVRRLDGDWSNPASPGDTGSDTYPSGNGTAGGDFVFRFRALPCDANQDGTVDIFDVAKLQVDFGQTSGMMPADGDFDGNGTVDIFDVALLQVAFGTALEPPAPAPSAAAEDGDAFEIGYSGEAGVLAGAPDTPDLLAASDTGYSTSDNQTSLDNSAPEKAWQFSVGNTLAGATVTLYADGIAIGRAVAESTTTTVTTNGSLDLADGARAITARQALPWQVESGDSAALSVTIDTAAPLFLDPARLGGYDTSGAATDVAVCGTLAYVADSHAGLVIFDVSDPAAPVRLGGYDTAGYARGVAVSGTLAYVADGDSGLAIIDVNDPASPVQLAEFNINQNAHDVAVAGTRAYVVDGGGLQIIDVTNPATPTRLSATGTGGANDGIAVSGTRAYLAHGSGGLLIMDVSDPAKPVQIGSYLTNGMAYGVSLRGNLAYVACGGGGLQIIDVSNPAAPLRKGSCASGGSAQYVEIVGTTAYVAVDTLGLQIIDVSDPVAPVRMGGLDTSGHAFAVAVSGGMAYVADYAAGLQIIDVTIPGLPPAPDLQPASDTGASDTDNITDDDTPTFKPSVPASLRFRMYRDGVQISGDSESGTSYTAPLQPEGTCGYAVAAVDAAGNVSAPSPPLLVTVDRAIPAPPDLADVSDTGRSSTDNLTNLDNSGPDKALHFVIGNTMAGATLTLLADGIAVGSATASDTTTTVTTDGNLDLTDGIHAITVRQTRAGESQWRESAAFRFTVDTVPLAPLLAPDLQRNSDTGASATDNITADNTPTFDFWAPTGTYCRLYRDGVQISGDYESVSFTAAVQPDGTYAYQAASVDEAGNVSALSPALSVTVDTTIPPPPDLLPESDSGASNTDNITSRDNSQADKALRFSVGNTLPGATVTVYADGVALGSAVADGSTTTVASNGTFDLTDGRHVITARQTPAGQAEGSESAALNVIVDTVPQTSPWPPDLDPASDTGVSNTDNITADTTPTFILPLPAGWLYRFYCDGAQISSDLEAGETFTTAVQDEGTHSYAVVIVDAAGNVSALSPALSVTIDTSIPETPDLLAESDRGASDTDNLTDLDNSAAEKSLRFSVGNTVAGATVTLCADGIAIGSAVADGTTTIVTTNGSLDVADGVRAITARQTLAGHSEWRESLALNVTVDTVPASPPGSPPDLQLASDTGESDTDHITSDSTPTFAISLPAGSYFRFYRDGIQISGDRESGSTYTTEVQPDGAYNYAIALLDAAGNVSALSQAAPVTIDTSIPSAPDLLAISDLGKSGDDNLTCLDNSTPQKTLQFAVGNTILGATVTLYADGEAIGFALAGGPVTTVQTDGRVALAHGMRSITARQTLPGQTESRSSAALAIEIDTFGPTTNLVQLGALDTSGQPQGVAVAGTLAYVADGTAGLAIIDIANPAAPVLVGTLDTTGTASDVVVSGSLAYVADGSGGLVIIDVANPAAPVRRGGYATGGSAYGVAVAGTRAYVATGSTGLVVVDVANPAAPVRLGAYDTSGTAYDVGVAGLKAYVADGAAGLVIIDVTTPTKPTRLGAYDTSGDARGVTISGTLAYVADGTSLAIIDVSYYPSPSREGSVTTGGTAVAVALQDTLAYVVTGGSLELIDVRDPSAPVRMGSCRTSSGRAVAAADGRAYVAAYDGLEVMDRGSPLPPAAPQLEPSSDTGRSASDHITSDTTPTFRLNVPGWAYVRVYRDGVQVTGDYELRSDGYMSLYYTSPVLAEGTYEFAIVAVDPAGNVSPSSPAVSVTIDASIPSPPDLLALSDSGVSSTDNLTNLDNSQADKTLQFAVGNTIPGATVTLYADGVAIGSAVADGSTTTVTTNGAYDLPDGKHIITARQTPPGRPESLESAAPSVTIDTAPNLMGSRLLGSYNTAGYSEAVTVANGRAYLADGSAGVVVFELTNPAIPTRLGAFDTPGSAVDVAVAGTLAYVADNDAGLLVLDVANPAAPVQRSALDTSGTARGVALSESLAYVADGSAGLVIIDVSNPAAPVRLGTFDTPGDAWDVAVFGSLAYVADDSAGLVVIDVSDPTAPVQLGSLAIDGRANGVAVSGTTVYVAGNLELAIIDVANPAAPVRLGRYQGIATDVFLSGTLAYVAGGFSGLLILNVADPALPVLSGEFNAGGYALGVWAVGTRAYIASADAGLQLIDASSPDVPSPPDLQPNSDTGFSNSDNATADSSPTFDVLVPAGQYFRISRDGVQISGDFETGTTYTAAPQPDGSCEYALALVDAAGNASVSSPPLPVTVDSSIPWTPDLMAVSDTGLSSADNLTNLDNSRPDKSLRFAVGNTIIGATVTLYADGTPVGTAVAEGSTTTIATDGARDLLDGMHVITARQTVPGGPESTDSAALTIAIDTVPDLALPPRIGGLDTSGTAYGVAVSGTLAYVADYSAGLVIFDISNPASPVRLGGFDTAGQAYAVAISGTVAYVADAGAGLVMIDVANPAAPVRLGALATNGSACDVAVSGNVAYLADYYAGLVIIDVANPAVPVRLGSYNTAGLAWGVAVSGTTAYVADDAQGLQVIDVTNPAQPEFMGGYDTSGTARDVAISGSLACVADGAAGLQVIDVSNPRAPVRLGGYDTSGSALGVGVFGTRAYVADGSAGLQIIDIAVPAFPARLAGFKASGGAAGVAVSGTTVYVAGGTAGLQIVDASIDTVGPPPALDLQPASDTGTSDADNFTGDRTPTFSLSLPAETYFRLYRAGIQVSGDYSSGVAYTTPVQPDGTYDYTVAAVDAAGNVSPQSPPLSVTIDTAPPTVTNVLVGGTNWTAEFFADLNAANGQNVGGYAVPVGTGSQLLPLAWGNIDQIKIVFSEGVPGDQDNLTLTGIGIPSFDLAGAAFSYDPATFTATWTLAGSLPADKLEIRLNADGVDPVQDPIARRLDGEWTNPLSPADTNTDTYPSGNGTAGGDFVFRFRVLPCDANQDGTVDIFDVAKLQVNFGQTSGMMPADGDFDGNGTVDIFDVALLQVAYGTALEPPAPAPSAAPSGENMDHATPEPLLSAMPSAADDLVEAVAIGGVSRPTVHTVPAKRADATNGASASWSAVDHRHIRRNGAHAASRPMQPLAVHHAVENASWESAVDHLLESEEVELAR